MSRAKSSVGPITRGVRKRLREGPSQDAHDFFGEQLGRSRADRLSYFWSNMYDNRTEYDKLMGYGISKRDKFIRRAESEGFTSDEIQAFLSL